MSETIDGVLADLAERRKLIEAREKVLWCLNESTADLERCGAGVEVSVLSEGHLEVRIALPGFPLHATRPVTMVDHLRAIDAAEVEAEATGAHYAPGPRQAVAEIPQVSPEAKTGAPQAAAEGEDRGGSDVAPVEEVATAKPALLPHEERLTADPEPSPETAPIQSRSGLPWDESEDDEIVETVAANRVSRSMGYNETMAMIAARIGRTASTVSNRASAVLKDRIMLREVALRREAKTQAATVEPEPAAPAISDPILTEPAAIAEPEPAPRVEIVPPAPPFQTGQPLWWREIEDRLNRIGNPEPFTPAIDLALLEQLAKGHKLGWVSTDLGIDLAALKARFARLVPGPGIASQERVMQVLRARAEREAA